MTARTFIIPRKGIKRFVGLNSDATIHSEIEFCVWQLGKLSSNRSECGRKRIAFEFFKSSFEIEVKMKSSNFHLS